MLEQQEEEEGMESFIAHVPVPSQKEVSLSRYLSLTTSLLLPLSRHLSLSLPLSRYLFSLPPYISLTQGRRIRWGHTSFRLSMSNKKLKIENL